MYSNIYIYSIYIIYIYMLCVYVNIYINYNI